MTRSKTLKRVNTLAKNKAKVEAVKKSTPTKQKAKAVVSKKVSARVKPKTKVKAVKKVSAPSKQKAKAVVSKKASAPVKPKTKVNTIKKVSAPSKQKTKAVVKKAINGTNSREKNTELKAKRKSPEEKTKIVIESRPTIDIHGEDLHFIPEHNGITHPVKPLEAHKMENIFHHKEEVAFHQENQKMRNALPSRKSMKVFNRNRGK